MVFCDRISNFEQVEIIFETNGEVAAICVADKYRTPGVGYSQNAFALLLLCSGRLNAPFFSNRLACSQGEGRQAAEKEQPVVIISTGRGSRSDFSYLVICGRASARPMDAACATLEGLLDSSKHIIAQLLRLAHPDGEVPASASFVHQSGL